MCKKIYSAILFVFFSTNLFSNYSETRIYRFCTNFQYPVSISFTGRLNTIPNIGHSYLATYDTLNKTRLISVKHFYNGKHLPVYNYTYTDYFGGTVNEYSLTASVHFSYDNKNRLSSTEMRSVDGMLCHNKYGTAKYSYNYDNQSSFDCYETREYLDTLQRQKTIKKPSNLQISTKFHLEFQLIENKFWQRKLWYIGINDYMLKYIEFYSNGEEKLIQNWVIGSSDYEDLEYNDLGVLICRTRKALDGKPYGLYAMNKSEIINENGFIIINDSWYSFDNGEFISRTPKHKYIYDQTYTLIQDINMDSTGLKPDINNESSIYSYQPNSYGGFSTIDSAIIYPMENSEFKTVLVTTFSYDDKGLLKKVTRKDKDNKDYQNEYTASSEELSYTWSKGEIKNISDVKITYITDEQISTVFYSFDKYGFLCEQREENEFGETYHKTFKYLPSSFLAQSVDNQYQDETMTSHILEEQDSYTLIDSVYLYGKLSVVRSKYAGNNQPVMQEIISGTSSIYSAPFKLDSYGEIKKYIRTFDNKDREINLKLFFTEDSLDIYYKYKDEISLVSFNNSKNFIEIALKQNNVLVPDDDRVTKYNFEYDDQGNNTKAYQQLIDNDGTRFKMIATKTYNSSLIADLIAENAWELIPVYEYDRQKLLKKVTFWDRENLLKKAVDARGIHEYHFTYDENQALRSIIAIDEVTQNRTAYNKNKCETVFLLDKNDNVLCEYSKDVDGNILETELEIKKYNDYYKIISKKYFKVVNNQFIKSSPMGYHEENLQEYVEQDENSNYIEIEIKSFSDEQGKIMLINNVKETVIIKGLYSDTIACSYYNENGFVSEDSLLNNLVDSVFLKESNEWSKVVFMTTKQSDKGEIIREYKNSKGEPVNNKSGFACLIKYEGPDYSYKKYYDKNQKLAFKGDSKLAYYEKTTHPKPYETLKIILNDRDKEVKNEFGISAIYTTHYWLQGLKVIENKYIDAKSNRKKTDFNGVHKVVSYLNTESDTLIVICFDKKNKVIAETFKENSVNIMAVKKINLNKTIIHTNDNSNLYVDSVELHSTYTKIKFLYEGMGSGNIYIDNNCKLIQEGTNIEFKLKKSEIIPISKAYGETTLPSYIDDENYIPFYLYFDLLPKGRYMFVENLYSKTAWNTKEYSLVIGD